MKNSIHRFLLYYETNLLPSQLNVDSALPNVFNVLCSLAFISLILLINLSSPSFFVFYVDPCYSALLVVLMEVNYNDILLPTIEMCDHTVLQNVSYNYRYLKKIIHEVFLSIVQGYGKSLFEMPDALTASQVLLPRSERERDKSYYSTQHSPVQGQEAILKLLSSFVYFLVQYCNLQPALHKSIILNLPIVRTMMMNIVSLVNGDKCTTDRYGRVQLP